MDFMDFPIGFSHFMDFPTRFMMGYLFKKWLYIYDELGYTISDIFYHGSY